MTEQEAKKLAEPIVKEVVNCMAEGKKINAIPDEYKTEQELEYQLKKSIQKVDL